MSDKKAAYLFGTVFEELAKHSDKEGIKESAKKIYEESLEFDFADEAMDCDAALIKLGLARTRGIDYGTTIEYGPKDVA